MYLSLILTIILSANTFQESPLFPLDTDKNQISKSISFSNSKKLLKNIYLRSSKNLTFYCGCSFDLKKD